MPGELSPEQNLEAPGHDQDGELKVLANHLRAVLYVVGGAFPIMFLDRFIPTESVWKGKLEGAEAAFAIAIILVTGLGTSVRLAQFLWDGIRRHYYSAARQRRQALSSDVAAIDRAFKRGKLGKLLLAKLSEEATKDEELLRIFVNCLANSGRITMLAKLLLGHPEFKEAVSETLQVGARYAIVERQEPVQNPSVLSPEGTQ